MVFYWMQCEFLFCQQINKIPLLFVALIVNNVRASKTDLLY